MATGTALVKLIDDLRAECRLSLSPAHNAQVRETQVKLLQRVQDRLYEDFTWPHLRVRRDVTLQAGQRYYDTPDEIRLDRIERIEVFRDSAWFPLTANIDAGHYATYNSDLDERAWPPMRWQIHENEDIEIWPIADRNGNPVTFDGVMRFTGTRNLRPLVADTDRADLDDRLIVLYAAAEMLAADGAKDAKLKLDQANDLLKNARSGLTPRRKFRMFGTGQPEMPRRMQVGTYRPAVDT